MRTSTRKWHEVDILKIYSNYSAAEWNQFLSKSLLSEDFIGLAKTYYGLQVGMTRIAKQKLSNPKIDLLFVRLTRSIEITIKSMYKFKYPSVLDDPQTALNLKATRPERYKALVAKKRNRDQLCEKLLRKESF